MPIHGVTNAPPRFTRAGHIRLGIKKQGQRGLYPEKSDHFIADFESEESTRLFHEIYGDKPTKITVAFAHEAVGDIFPQWYKAYGKSSGLKCKGDGQTAQRADANGDLYEVDCPGPAECDFAKQHGCKQMANLQFFIRGLPGFQIFQVNTTSWNSIRNINSGLEMLRVVRGGKPVRGVWVDLYLVPQQAQHEGKTVQIYVMKLDIPTNLDNLKALECALDIDPVALPKPDDSRDEYLTPTQVEALPEPAPEPDGPSAEARVAFREACAEMGLDLQEALRGVIAANGVGVIARATDAMLRGYIRAEREARADAPVHAGDVAQEIVAAITAPEPVQEDLAV